MKNIHILLFLLLCLSNIINVYNSTLKQKTNHSITKIKANNRFPKRNNKKILSKRKLDISCESSELEVPPAEEVGKIEDPEIPPGVEVVSGEGTPTVELNYKPLNILIDTEELFASCPEGLEGYKNIILEAMNKAKAILEGFLEILVDPSAQLNKIDSEGINLFEYHGISHYSTFFDGNFNLNNYNYFIFGKFIYELDNDIDSASYCIDKQRDVPYIGIVFLNENIATSKLTLEYLTPLMLHQFIQLLGFNDKVINYDSDYSEYRLNIDEHFNAINYAIKYFGCGDIGGIALSSKEEGTHSYNYNGMTCSYPITALYWPKRILLGELLTRFDYPEEQVLSGFTLNLLKDLGYLKVKKEYTGGLMRFGKHKGCYFFSNYCSNSYYDDPTFANEFFLPPYSSDSSILPLYPSCSSGRLSKTAYQPTTIPTGKVDPRETFYGRLRRINTRKNSRVLSYNEQVDEECTITQFPSGVEDGEEYYYGSCFDSNTAINTKRSEVLGSNSFCVLSSLEEGRNINPTLLPLCYEMKCSSKSLSIKVGDYYIVCPREGGKIFAEHFNGFIMCPDYNLICTGSTMCNNLLDCINKKSTEKEASLLNYDYNNNGDNEDDEIKTTQNPFEYSKYYRDYGWELATDGVCLNFVCNVNLKQIVKDVNQNMCFLMANVLKLKIVKIMVLMDMMLLLMILRKIIEEWQKIEMEIVSVVYQEIFWPRFQVELIV